MITLRKRQNKCSLSINAVMYARMPVTVKSVENLKNRELLQSSIYPSPKKNNENNIAKFGLYVARKWEWYGRLGDDMELISDHILARCKI